MRKIRHHAIFKVQVDLDLGPAQFRMLLRHGIGAIEHPNATDIAGKFENLGVVDVVHGQSAVRPLPYIGSV